MCYACWSISFSFCPYQAYVSIVAQNDNFVKHKQNTLIPQPIFLGSPKHQLVNFIPVCFPGIDAERLIYKLEAQEVLVSTGAACAANKGTKSHVLAAIGLSDIEIAGSLRISLGSANTIEQIQQAATIIIETVRQEYIRVGLTSYQPSSSPATRSSSGLSLQAEASSSIASDDASRFCTSSEMRTSSRSSRMLESAPRVDKSSSLSTGCGMVAGEDGCLASASPNRSTHA